ncbi:hypothetical protein ZWY2020_034155 [Hordeum vulgare]|nr:hypothetical protein ZWY2020_034155 [Hordeum vulgare]
MPSNVPCNPGTIQPPASRDSPEISLNALLGVQRHGQDLAYRLAQGVSGLLLHVQLPQLPWPAPPLPLKLIPFDIELPAMPFVGGGGVDLPAVAVASFVEIGGRLGQAGSDLGASVGGAAAAAEIPCVAPCMPPTRCASPLHHALHRSARPCRCRRLPRRCRREPRKKPTASGPLLSPFRILP